MRICSSAGSKHPPLPAPVGTVADENAVAEHGLERRDHQIAFWECIDADRQYLSDGVGIVDDQYVAAVAAQTNHGTPIEPCRKRLQDSVGFGNGAGGR